MSVIVKYGLMLLSAAGLLLTSEAQAAEIALDKGNTVWVMVAGMFVLLMCIPGLAMFYGGFIRSKNVLSLHKCLLVLASLAYCG